MYVLFFLKKATNNFSIEMHHIKIVNLNNTEKVTHSFVLIKGYVINSENSNCPETKDRITLKTAKYQLSHPVQADSGRFKILVELTSGLNEFKITYCCANLTFCLEYIEPATESVVSTVYIICAGHDGKFQAPEYENNSIESACSRILTGAKLLQCIVAEKLFEFNLGRRTFKLEKDCHVFHSKLHCDIARKMRQDELWTYFAREIISSPLKSDNRKILALLSCTRYRSDFKSKTMLYEDILDQTQAHVALAAGGLALFGTGCLYTWPEDITQVIPRFLNENQVDTSYFMDDSCYRGTLGSCFSTTLGSALHELCHLFDLGHTETGIMGRGFDNVYKVFTLNALEKKTYPILKNRLEDDQTHWTESCTVLLRYHKWINVHLQQNSILQFNSDTGCVKSTAGIRVIEIRRARDQMVLISWIFTSKILKFLFSISKECFSKFKGQNVVVLIEDNIGKIIKENVAL